MRRGMEMIAAKAKAGSTKDSNGEPTEVNWGIGEMEFEAYMRTLDKAVSARLSFCFYFTKDSIQSSINRLGYL